MVEKVIVTGGLGFIGSHVVELLLKQGSEVIIFDDESTGHNHNDKATFIKGDITVAEDIAKLPKDADYIIHLAAAISVPESVKNPAKYQRINVEGTDNILKWAIENKTKSVVSASSAAVYGNPNFEDLPLSETYMDKENNKFESPYAETKFETEILHKKYFASDKLRGTSLRFFNVYGPRQDPRSPYSGVISKFFDCATQNVDIPIFGDGKNTRDFVFCGDVANACVLAMRKEELSHDVFNVGTEGITTITKLAETIKELSNSTSGIKYLEPRLGDVVHSRSSTASIRSKLGFAPTRTLEQGMKETLEWFQNK